MSSHNTPARIALSSLLLQDQDKGEFRLKQAINSQFYWVIKASNYETICLSENYTSKYSALNGIYACQNYAPGAHIIDDTINNGIGGLVGGILTSSSFGYLSDTKGKFHIRLSNDYKHYWVLKAPNGEILCTSETYNSKHAAYRGIDACKRYALTASIVII